MPRWSVVIAAAVIGVVVPPAFIRADQIHGLSIRCSPVTATAIFVESAQEGHERRRSWHADEARRKTRRCPRKMMKHVPRMLLLDDQNRILGANSEKTCRAVRHVSTYTDDPSSRVARGHIGHPRRAIATSSTGANGHYHVASQGHAP